MRWGVDMPSMFDDLPKSRLRIKEHCLTANTPSEPSPKFKGIKCAKK